MFCALYCQIRYAYVRLYVFVIGGRVYFGFRKVHSKVGDFLRALVYKQNHKMAFRMVLYYSVGDVLKQGCFPCPWGGYD